MSQPKSILYLVASTLIACLLGACGTSNQASSAASINNSASTSENSNASTINSPSKSTWLVTWTTAPQLVEPGNNPPAPGLSDNTLRQVFKISVGGETLRMKFSNEFSTSATELKSVYLAESNGGGAIDPNTNVRLTFNGSPSISIPAGQAIYSDTFVFPVAALSRLAVSIHFGRVPQDITGHPGSRTTSYLQTGAAETDTDLSVTTKTDHWYVISGLEVMAPESYGAIAILGDSITDGRGSTTNGQNRWPDQLSERLQSNSSYQHIAVLNQGIGGGCLTTTCLGPKGVDRFERDILNQPGVRWVIVFIGTNDIGGNGSDAVASNIISHYQTLVSQAKARGLKIYGATLTPTAGSNYAGGENARTKVNNWIRSSEQFDGVIDMENAVSDNSNPPRFKANLHDGDWLHPNVSGYKAMADAVDLSLFD